MKKVMIAAGGTGGHVFPGLAVAAVLQQQGVDVVWCGSRHGKEKEWVKSCPFYSIHIQSVRRGGIRRKLLMPVQLLKAVWQARNIIRQAKPDCILAMGGFVAGPAGLAAWLMRVPLVVHEQNAKAGLTNRWLARFAAKVLQAFPMAFPTSVGAETVGNPVAQSVMEVGKEVHRVGDKCRLLVLGGSQGAHFINQQIQRLVAKWADKALPVEIWHQTGERDSQWMQECYQSVAFAKAEPFIVDMAKAYRWADLVIARAGAMTVFELASAGRPSVLFPYPFAVDDHQLHNAQFLQRVGAAIIQSQSDFDFAEFEKIIEKFVREPAELSIMAQQAKKIAMPESAVKVAESCRQVVC